MDKAVIARKADKIIITRCIPEAAELVEQTLGDLIEKGIEVDKVMQIRDWPEVEAFLAGSVTTPKKKKFVLSKNKKGAVTAKAVGKTDAVKKVLAGVSRKGALTGREVAENAGLMATDVSEPLIRLSKTGKIGVTGDKPKRYFDISFSDIQKRQVKEDGGKMECAMRNYKKISRGDCVPNQAAKECSLCAWGKEAAA